MEAPKPKKVKISLDLLALEEAGKQRYPELAFSACEDNEQPILNCTSRKLYKHPPLGPISRVKVIVEADGCYDLQVLMHSKEKGSVSSKDEYLDVLKTITEESGHKFCPGLPPDVYNLKYYEVLRYHSKNVRITMHPVSRIDSQNCLLWHRLAKNASIFEKDMKDVMCSSCKRLRSDLDQRVKRVESISMENKENRVLPCSHFPEKYLSPKSVKKKKKNVQVDRIKHKNLAEKFSSMEVSLSDEQHNEMCEIMKKLNSDGVDKSLAEGDVNGVGQTLRAIWNSDVENIQQDFREDQERNTTGKKDNRWNLVTIRLALAVYTRSPAAYEELKNFGLIQLPCRATLQAYTGAFRDDAGTSSERLREELKRFNQYKVEATARGCKPAKGDGALIFDEVRVVCRLMWNSRSHQLVGLAMSHEELSSLSDIYQLLQTDSRSQQTSYIMQFLWRDLTSSFDVVGPYYTSSGPLESKFILSCMIDSLRVMHLNGFRTCCLVCDAAAANVAVVKATTGVEGAYSESIVDPKFINPFDPSRYIHWLICPSHQLKNMVNALYSSQRGGTKAFEFEGVCFGWKAITDMYKRECDRRNSGRARMVPRMRESYVIRDSWTKLNVSPAKIMQQEHVLTELYHHLSQSPPPSDAPSVKSTLQYLEACNKLFEKGLLSHGKVTGDECELLKNIDEGMLFFHKWLDGLKEDPTFKGKDPTQRLFMAWQTWDNLRILTNGFKSLCIDFISRYPDHYITPLRVSGSSVETLFSQYKHLSGNKLDSVNYTTARAKYLCNKSVAASHHSGKYYRDMPLDIPQIQLQKKKYGDVKN